MSPGPVKFLVPQKASSDWLATTTSQQWSWDFPPRGLVVCEVLGGVRQGNEEQAPNVLALILKGGGSASTLGLHLAACKKGLLGAPSPMRVEWIPTKIAPVRLV